MWEDEHPCSSDRKRCRSARVPKRQSCVFLVEENRDRMIDAVKKKYIVTIFGAEQSDGSYQYRNSIMAFDEPHFGTQLSGRSYKDDSEMIQIVNSVMPDGDIRNALHVVKRHEGYTIHILLTQSEAELLGYRLPV
jgi:hypothetical protein